MPEVLILTTCYLVWLTPVAYAMKDKIIGGVEVSIKDYPYQVSLETEGNFFCGGTIITPDKVLTAAHCAVQEHLLVRCGSDTTLKGGQPIQVKYKRIHPLYRINQHDYDIAVLTLKKTFQLDDKCAIAQLSKDKTDRSRTCRVSGWGLVEGSKLPNKLIATNVREIPRKKCKQMYREHYAISDRMICFGNEKGGKDSCQGDSGGPLVDPKTRELVGVTSWGLGCGLPDKPGVYVKVAVLHNWIMNEIKPNSRSSASKFKFFCNIFY